MSSHDINEEVNPAVKVKTGIYHAFREKNFDKTLTPFEEFIHSQTTSGLLMMVRTGLPAGGRGRFYMALFGEQAGSG